MGLFGSSEQKKREKKLRETLKQVQKRLVALGYDKRRVAEQFKSFEDTVIYADALQKNYNLAKNTIGSAISRIDAILNGLGEQTCDIEKQELKTLTEELNAVYHEALIRPDDTDFISTADSLKKLAIGYCKTREGAAADAMTGGTASMASPDTRTKIMLRSELENVRSVLSDAYGWAAPDFMALAYYFRREDAGEYAGMENDRRNAGILAFYIADFSKEFDAMLDESGEMSHVRDAANEYREGTVK